MLQKLLADLVFGQLLSSGKKKSYTYRSNHVNYVENKFIS